MSRYDKDPETILVKVDVARSMSPRWPKGAALVLSGCSSDANSGKTEAPADTAETTEVVEETTEETAAADETPTPPWADELSEGDFVSTTPSVELGAHLDLFEEHTYTNPDTATHTVEYDTPGPDNSGMVTGTMDVEVGDLKYYVYDPCAHGADPEGITGWFKEVLA